MSSFTNNQGAGERRLQETLRDLEDRIARLEGHLGLPEIGTASEARQPAAVPAPVPDSGLEFRIGEYVLAWMGGFILLLGLFFLIAYTAGQGYRLASLGIGFAGSAALFGLARLWWVNFSNFARIMLLSSVILLYYTTVRLHFFSADPLVRSPWFALALMLAVVALQLYLAVSRRWAFLGGLAVTMGMTSALFADVTHVTLPIIAGVCLVALRLAARLNWWKLLLLTLVLAYSAHLLWFFNNPIAGNPLEAVTEHQYNLVYLLIYATVFAWPALSFRRDPPVEFVRLVPVFLNCLALCALGALLIPVLYVESYARVALGAALFFLTASMILWRKTHHPFVPAVYACFGYFALSVAIYGFSGMPLAFFWLALQSLLVVSMALWFRSRILVVANVVIYMGILAAYGVLSPLSHSVNFCFAFVSLGSARIMNWKRERLTLKTQNLRILYLSLGFLMVLYSLQTALPAQYVALSWTIAAVAYFLVSVILRNIKYRWMALFTFFATVVYLFLVDLPRLDAEFRVAAFIFLGLMALGISVFYSKLKRFLKKP